ncbi:MAG: hypothetical protein JKY57_04355, partial [Kordiimonadaceae bacterium]|nr:hypothetical protein [Kordiimonadaceae bacterium]
MGKAKMDFETLDVTINGAVAQVTLNRPDKLNAMNGTMLAEIGAAFRALDEQTN